MVISIGISKYESNIYENLPDVDNDISYYNDVFNKIYHYKFFKNDLRNKWTRNDIKKFMRKYKKRELLIENDEGDIELKHDGLILTLSGHGSYDSLICSDGKRYKYKDKRQFFSNEDELCKIPKIILVDACRIDDDNINNNNNNQLTTRAPAAKQFSSTIMATTEGNTVRGGKIAFSIAKEFNKNFQDNNDLKQELQKWKKFGSIRKAAKKMIAEHTDQSMVVNEHDDDIDEVIFLPSNCNKDYDKKKKVNNNKNNNKLITITPETIFTILNDNEIKQYLLSKERDSKSIKIYLKNKYKNSRNYQFLNRQRFIKILQNIKSIYDLPQNSVMKV